MKTELETAWATWRDEIESLRELLLAQEWIDLPGAHASALTYLQEMQAAAYNLVIAPRRGYPALYQHTVFQPVIYPNSLNCADFIYRFGFLDGARTYRIRGRRGSTCWADMQCISKLWGMPGARKVGSCDFDRIDLGDDGSFEVIAGGPPRDRNWLPLDPDSGDNFILMREAFSDWERQEGMRIQIELADGRPAGPVAFTDEEVVRRLPMAIDFIRFVFVAFSIDPSRRVLDAVGWNGFIDEIFPTDPGAGNHPAACYPGGLYRLEEDQALVIECDIPRSRYWSVQVGNLWWEAVDYTYHQSTLNITQAVLDPDGRFRAVISKRDPGVPNWLDPMDDLAGSILFRFYGNERPVCPRVLELVPMDQVRRVLPASTAEVGPEQRARALKLRRDHVLARFGY